MRNYILFVFAILITNTYSFAAETQEKTPAENASSTHFAVARKNMVEQYVVSYGMLDKNIIQAFLKVPRHEFVAAEEAENAYSDKPVKFYENMSMPRPYETALMTKLLDLKPTDKVLELGTGSGYHTAILSQLCKDVYTVDIQENIKKLAEERFVKLGYKNIHCLLGEGQLGWPQEAPFDAIIVGFAADSIIPELLKQLKDKGRLVIPVESKSGVQELKLVIKDGETTKIKDIIPVKFSSMIKTEAKTENQ